MQAEKCSFSSLSKMFCSLIYLVCTAFVDLLCMTSCDSTILCSVGHAWRNMVTWSQTCYHIPAIELELPDVVETKIKIYTHAVDAIIGDECACTF